MELLISDLNRLSLAHQVNFYSSAGSGAKKTEKAENKNFVLGLSHEKNSDLLAVTTMDETVLIYNSSTLVKTGSLTASKETMEVKTGWRSQPMFNHARFGSENPSYVYATSYGGGLLLWDLRSPKSVSAAFTCDILTRHRLSYLSFDVSCDERLLAVGTSVSPDGDAYIAFWDTRSTGDRFVGVYEDCHCEDVTTLAFHPSRRSAMLSGASDGLLCSFDLNASCEDDALLLTCNSERSVARVGWKKKHASSSYSIYCISDMDTFHLWDAKEGDLQHEITSFKNEDWRYIVASLDSWQSSEETALLLLGDHNGELCIYEALSGRECVRLSGGHGDTVRCAIVTASRCLITGGEDGKLSQWQDQGDKVTGEAAKTKRRKNTSNNDPLKEPPTKRAAIASSEGEVVSTGGDTSPKKRKKVAAR